MLKSGVSGSMSFNYLGLFMVFGVGKKYPIRFLPDWLFFSAGKVLFLCCIGAWRLAA